MTPQSSTVVTFRALVMVACLVAIPFAALCGGSLPEMVRTVLNGGWPTGSTSAGAALSEAPQFEPMILAEGGPPSLVTATGSQWHAGPLSEVPGWPGQIAHAAPSAVVPAGYQVPLGSSAEAGRSSLPAGGPQQPRLAVYNAIPSGGNPPPAATGGRPRHQQDAVPRPAPATVTGSSGRSAPGSIPVVDRFTGVQQRLRQLGVTYYLLESWGSRPQLYRFYCKMALGGNPGHTRYFEATGDNPLQAMSRVLQEVEAWRAGRRLTEEPALQTNLANNRSLR